MYNENGEYEVREEFGDEILITQRIKKRIPRVLTIMALSFHAAFEGLAIGLETDASDVWVMFAGTNLTIEFMDTPKWYMYFRNSTLCNSNKFQQSQHINT